MSRKWLIPLVLLALFMLGLAALWQARVPIARNYVDRELARRGVPARYEITRFGLRSQRLENVVIGDPARPDLVARRIDLGFGMSGLSPTLRAIDAEGVRLFGRVVDGRLSIGAIDRLLPEPSGEPFALPDVRLRLADTRARIDAPWGAIGASLIGEGNVATGFSGRLAAVARRLNFGGCAVERPTAFVHLVTAGRRPAFDGPLRAATIACEGARIAAPQVGIDLALDQELDGWNGGAMFTTGAVALGETARIATTRGRIGIKGDVEATDARLNLSLAAVRIAGLDGALAGGAGTPARPFLAQLARTLDGASRAATVDAALRIADRGRDIRVAPLEVTGANGARLAVEASGSRGISLRDGVLTFDGRVALAGGGLPDAIATLRNGPGGLSGTIHMTPWNVPGGRLELDSLALRDSRLTGRMVVDGPVGDGRISRLALPLDLRRDGRGRLIVNPGCSQLSFAALRVANLHLDATRLPVCTGAGGLLAGGTIASPRIAGRLGDSPLTVSAQRIALTPAAAFVADRIAVGLGDSRLDMARLAGTANGGSFTGAAGKIGPVPLLMSEGAGRWKLAGSALSVDGQLAVSDAEPDPRFHRLESDDFALRLADGRIVAGGTLRYPGNPQTIARASIGHELGAGAGQAILDVPGISFGSDFQPDMLTRLALGVVANVSGTVSGQGRIFWTGESVHSGGEFTTDGVDLAAAFGPVRRLAGTIHFSDLLAMATPPGQRVTLGEVNPGVAVVDGVIDYQLLPDQIVRIESGRWPFSGGQLSLEPTSLDFGQPVARHLTFRVEGMDAALFVQQFGFKNISVSGVFDGALPMVFDADGGRIVGGRMAVRQGGGTLAYVGELSNADLGRFAGMAFDALKAIRYDNLVIELDGSLDGEIVSRVLFNGVNKAPIEERRAMVRQLTGLPFRFNITITAPFRSLINSAQSINDPRGLVSDAIARQRAATPSVQPQESEKLP